MCRFQTGKRVAPYRGAWSIGGGREPLAFLNFVDAWKRVFVYDSELIDYSNYLAVVICL